MCCSQWKRAVKKKSTDIYGNKLTFFTFSHGMPTHCKQFTITKETFSFKKWSVFMTIFSFLAFYVKFHNTDVQFLVVILCLLCLLLLLRLHFKVKEESLLVIASLGLQLTTTFVTGRKASQFILWRNIEDVVINEAITMHRVLHYLAVLLKDTDGSFGIKAVIPLFQGTLPRLDCLERIYRGVQIAFSAEDQ